MAALVVHLVSVLALALLVEVVCRLGRFRPALCHALWLVVLIKLIVPPVLTWPGGEFNFTGVRPSLELTGEVPEVAPRQAVGNLSLSQEPPEEYTADILETAAPPAISAITGDTLRLTLWVLWGWGSLFLGLQFFRRARAARRIAHSGVPAPEWLQHKLVATCDALGVARIKATIVNTGCGSVYVHFLGDPILVVSDTALAHIESDRWAPILTHEMAHLKRRDHWVAWAMLAAGILWWWNPCLWWVRNRVHHFSELACDAWVVASFPEERKSYAETMVRILALLSEQRSPALTLGLAVWSPAAQERRLWMIMKGNGACRMPWMYAAGVIALSGLVTPAWFATAADNESTPKTVADGTESATDVDRWTLDLAPAKKAQESLTSIANVEFTDLHIENVIEFIQDSFDINIVIDSRVVQPPPTNQVVPINPNGPRPAPGVAPMTLPSVEEASPFHHDYVTDGIVAHINKKSVPLADVLTDLLTPMGLTYTIQGRIIWISATDQIERDNAVPLPYGRDRSSAVLDSLDSKISIEFEDIHLHDILEFIQKVFEIDVLLDPRVVAPEPVRGEAKPESQPGQVTDGMVSYINVKNVSLGETLFFITRILNLSYRVEGEGIYISTPEGVKPGVAAFTP